MSKPYRNAALLFAAIVATACTTGPEYQPRTPGSTVGYTDLQLSPDRYRVTYTGGFNSTQDDVETNLLRRAAEVTLQNGYSHFVIQRRQTQPVIEGRTYAEGPYYPYWGNYWIATSYSSYAEILMLKDAEAANAPEAVDAGRVLVGLNVLPVSNSVKTADAAKP